MFLGFIITPYNKELLSIFKNITPLIIIISLKEIFRYTVCSKTDNKFTLSFLIIALIVFDIFFVIDSYDLKSVLGIFEVITCLVIPSIANNILLTFISKKSGFIPPILFGLFTTLYIFIIPIVPDLGIYLESIVKLVLPVILFLRINTLFGKNNFRIDRTKIFYKVFFTTFLVAILLFLVVLISGVFRYYMMAIGSNSMHNTINKGDAVIIKKLKEKEIYKIKKGDILVYKHDSKIIVHRIVEINMQTNNTTYVTKGDNNDTKDNWIIEKYDIIGIVKNKISYIGYPSVWLKEKFK